MEKDINFKFEDIYSNMDEKNEKPTKKLLNDSDSTDPFFCSYICNSLFYCCCFFLSE